MALRTWSLVIPSPISDPHPPNIKYSQYIIIYHVMGVFDTRGVNIRRRGLVGLRVGIQALGSIRGLLPS